MDRNFITQFRLTAYEGRSFMQKLSISLRNPLFYRLSFNPGSLRMDTVIRCGMPVKPYDGYTFVRRGWFYFDLLYNGSYTYCGYFTDCNEVD